MRRRTNYLSFVIREADAAGLSYGQYVAQERVKRVPHRKAPPDYLSINDRKKHGIGTPIYCGATLVETALPYDCPRTVDRLIREYRASLPPSKPLEERVVEMYLDGCAMSEIHNRLQCPYKQISRILREAGVSYI